MQLTQKLVFVNVIKMMLLNAMIMIIGVYVCNYSVYYVLTLANRTVYNHVL